MEIGNQCGGEDVGWEGKEARWGWRDLEELTQKIVSEGEGSGRLWSEKCITKLNTTKWRSSG